MTFIVTIDGPAASGKTSVSRELANRLDWAWVSTGAFYRGLAYVSQQTKLDLSDELALAETATSAQWRVVMDDLETRVFFNGSDVSDKIRQESVGTIASQISQYPEVRRSLLRAQRACSLNVSGLVAEGRDCGSVIFPQAQVKVFLTAKREHRAWRRAIEEGTSVETVLEGQTQRDQLDSSRKTAPLLVPPGAQVLDTSKLQLSEVVDVIESWVKRVCL